MEQVKYLRTLRNQDSELENLVLWIDRGTQAEDFQDQGGEEDIWD